MPSLSYLKTRADLYRKIREFFYARQVLEVETPLLCSHTVTDLHVNGIQAAHHRFLQTSPEYAMKRLLSLGSGPIFQLCKAFRDEEMGSNHNPEFTMLEWYRPGFNHHDLMSELNELMMCLLNTPPATRQSYRDCFLQHTSLDPFTADQHALHAFIKHHHLLHDTTDIDHDTALQVILSEYIEPRINQDTPFFIYDFPATQACLAVIRRDNPAVGERFELYFKGYELANGFHELTDPHEQEQRFLRDQNKRRERGLYVPEIDYYLIDALKKGLTPTAGVAVGVDRLVMLACHTTRIQDVLCFPWDSC